MNIVLSNFMKKYWLHKKMKMTATLENEYRDYMRKHFKKLAEEKKFDEAWLLLKKLSEGEDYQALRLRHVHHISIGCPDLGEINAYWFSLMVFDFSTLIIFSDLVFGNPTNRAAKLMALEYF